ncbi:hypothetical protein NGB36_06370 [Streptomyces sp. RB6PN25]|uniref:Integral membrane protein n=1 Tax=Streptomyces humicola TaxID=2953240 RepID=A0ABT1PRD8_9ACTN|nr:hypothetical protein [Streptomyces humicola]MCQ4080229.1 hypothetical protein [Streptomyces humicola]
MIWEALGSALVGLAAAWAALRWLPRRFPSRTMVLATGPSAGLVGGLITRIILGPGHIPVTLVAALAVGAAILSLLVRAPAPRRSRTPRVV